MSPKGNLFTKGPGAYKIPGFGDIPMKFNVHLLKNSPNMRAVYSSKVSTSIKLRTLACLGKTVYGNKPYCYIIAEGFFFILSFFVLYILPFGLVRLRTFQLSAWVS